MRPAREHALDPCLNSKSNRGWRSALDGQRPSIPSQPRAFMPNPSSPLVVADTPPRPAVRTFPKIRRRLVVEARRGTRTLPARTGNRPAVSGDDVKPAAAAPESQQMPRQPGDRRLRQCTSRTRRRVSPKWAFMLCFRTLRFEIGAGLRTRASPARHQSRGSSGWLYPKRGHGDKARGSRARLMACRAGPLAAIGFSNVCSLLVLVG